MLPYEPKPIFQYNPKARILIAGQAPGHKAHKSGIPFDDASGDRLRDWMGIDKTVFYDAKRIAILPMGFCFPGRGKTGDLPPMSICKQTWHKQLLENLTQLQITLVIGKYALEYHLGKSNKTLTDVVSEWRSYLPSHIPLPHPSPRNNRWLKQNPWFEKELLPILKKRIKFESQ